MNLNIHNHWKYKNLAVVFISVAFAATLSQVESFHSFLLHLGNFGYIGALITGMLFTSTFTVATSILVLMTLVEALSPIEVGLIAGLGAVIGDLTILRVIKGDLSQEMAGIYNRVDKNNHVRNLLHTKYFNWMLPVFGAVIIASPLPDEIGISLMGIAKMKQAQFVVLSYILNSVGIFLVVSAAVAINH